MNNSVDKEATTTNQISSRRFIDLDWYQQVVYTRSTTNVPDTRDDKAERSNKG